MATPLRSEELKQLLTRIYQKNATALSLSPFKTARALFTARCKCHRVNFYQLSLRI